MADITVNRIDPTTSLYIEQVIIDEGEFLELNDPTLIRQEVPSFLYEPKWTGTEWVDNKPFEEILQHKKEQKDSELESACNDAILNGFTSVATGFEYEFDMEDQSNFAQQMIMLLKNPALDSVQWKTKNAGIQVHTRDQFIAVVDESEIHKRNQIGKLWHLRQSIATATTLEELNTIKW